MSSRSNGTVTGPLFKWFGSKWLSSKTLPAPIYDTIVEPFAGSAGYSLRYCDRDVLLYEKNDQIRSLWQWLIGTATQTDILDIPIGLTEGTDIRFIGLSPGQILLLKNWQRTNNVGNCWTVSPWCNKPGQWTESTRSRISEEFQAIRHWKIGGTDGMLGFNNRIATWFIDPPYQFNYQYRQAPISYYDLSVKALQCRGQVIVCEAACPKTQVVPNYLPFEFFGNRVTSRRKIGENHHSRELIWTRNAGKP